MTPAAIYRQAVDLGLALKPDDAGNLTITPADRCPSDFLATVRQHKREILEWFKQPPCPGWKAVPPTDLPLDKVRPRPLPADARAVMDYIMRQIGDKPSPLCEWCLRREHRYWEAYGWPDQECAYAAARDAVCWQLNRTESEVADFLESATHARIAAPT